MFGGVGGLQHGAIPSVVIDSIRPNPWYYNDTVSIHGINFGSSQGVVTCGLDTVSVPYWSSELINFVIPFYAPRGYNSVRVFISVGDSSNVDSVRVLRPYRWRP